MNEKVYSIAGIPFLIRGDWSDEEMIDMLEEPQPYNLYINYDIEMEADTICKYHANDLEVINIRKTEGNSSFIEKHNGLDIYVDIHAMLQHDYNWQFSLFGNKGIVQKYILHILEKKHKRIVFHGCAIRNQNDGRIIIGLGQSGAGKSVFVATALRNGWEMIATEQVILDDEMNIYSGNAFDNISPLSVKMYREWLTDAQIIDAKRLIEPLGQKVFVDMRKYAMTEDVCVVTLDKLSIANLDFQGKKSGVINIEDSDYFLRLLQISASEKISSPTIVKNRLVNVSFQGDTELRQNIIDKIIKSKAERFVLSGGFEGFDIYLKK